MSESAPHQGLTLVFLRQAFYLQQLRLVIAAFLTMLVLIGILSGMLYYFVHHPTHPIYFPTDSVSRLIVEPPLSQPNMSLENVKAWVVNAVQTTYSYDFKNYRGEFQNSQKFFTDYGWRQYLKGLSSSNNILALTEHKMLVSAKVVAPPKLLIQGIIGSQWAYKFEMPVLITYLEPPYDDKNKFTNPLTVTLIVKRQKLLESDHGLGIVQIIADLVTSQDQNMTAPGGG